MEVLPACQYGKDINWILYILPGVISTAYFEEGKNTECSCSVKKMTNVTDSDRTKVPKDNNSVNQCKNESSLNKALVFEHFHSWRNDPLN